jgi:tRNA(fMet)-specific endonuclease VapC
MLFWSTSNEARGVHVLILDTNIVSALLRGSNDVLTHYDNALDRNEILGISAVTYYELRRGSFDPKFARKRQTLNEFLDTLELVLPDFHTYQIAAEIWWNLKQAGTKLEDNDVLIAATAMSFDETLISDNTKHFDRITGLKLENWIERT